MGVKPIWIGVTLCLFLLAWGSLKGMLDWDEELDLKLDGWALSELLLMSGWEGGWIVALLGTNDLGHFPGNILPGVGYILLGGLLAALCIMDEQTYRIYNIFVGVGCLVGVAVGAMLYVQHIRRGLPVQLLVYGGLQYGLFTRWYGKGDCHAFFLCGLWIWLGGGGMWEYLLHMGASFGLLAMVQLGRRNVGSHGNLKKPVAFLPYICTTVWFFL